MRRQTRRLAALSGLLALLLVATALLFVLDRRQDEVAEAQDPRGEAIATATDALEAVLAYDYRSLEESLDRARGFLVGTAAEEYETTAGGLRNLVPQVQAVVTAQVVRIAPVDVADDRGAVRLLAYVDQRSATTVVPSGVDTVTVRMTVVEQDGAWKVSTLEPI
ncbi:unannotated protein [freshwater metagenome]|uniref:Unannotated protein n=1 Tax=freshwater metagenome TaxID=449393 RepID=A0A6J7LGU0_9ZZZZ